MITIPVDIKIQIEVEACKAYPNECCGIMLGSADLAGGGRDVKKILPVVNTFEDLEQYHRFRIEPEDLMGAEKEAFQEGLEVVGFYHSHPDHPAAPSGYDGEQALPFYSYVIVAVTKAGAEDFRSWQLKEDSSEFVEEGVDYGS